jgi:hypothetical protein
VKKKPPVQYAMLPPRVDAPQIAPMKPVQQPKVAKMRGIDLDYYLGPTGIPDKLRAVNSMLNPVEAVGGSMRASQRLFAPETDGWGRVQAAGDMLSGIGGFVAPMVAASKVGGPVASAVVDAFTGINTAPATQAAKTMATDFAMRDGGALRLYPGEYIGGHSAPTMEAGASLDNPTAMFGGDDIYSGNAMRYFGTGMDEADRESIAAISRARNKPKGTTWVYRAVPKDAPNEIGAGDWVTTSRAYAKDHGEANLGGRGNYKIVKEPVSPRELATDGNSINEWGWWPSEDRIKGALEGRMKKADRAQLEEYARKIGIMPDGIAMGR